MAYNFDTASYQTDKITINGVTMTLAEFKKMKRSEKAKKRKKKMKTEIQLLPQDVNYLLKDIKVVDSLIAFHRNGYRQWGRIHKELMKVDNMERTFILLNSVNNEVKTILSEIESSAKRSNKATYGIIRELSYKLTKLGEQLNILFITVHDSNIINSPFNSHEIINGTNRRLGLKILLMRTDTALNNMVSIINKLQDMSNIPDDYYNSTNTMLQGRLKEAI